MHFIKQIFFISYFAFGFFNVSYADSGIASAVAASVAAQVVNTGSAVYMKNNGMQPQFVSTPYGTYVVPTAPANTTPPQAQSKPQPSEYQIQNQQQQKQQFINGNVVQAFPGVAPSGTAG